MTQKIVLDIVSPARFLYIILKKLKTMKFSKIAELLRKRGYTEREPKDHYRIFYEFGAMDFLYADVAKKYEMEYRDGKVNEVVMIQYRFGETEFKYIKTLEELRDSL